MGEPIPFRRRRRRQLPPEWDPYFRREMPAAQIRIMVWLGLLVGLLAWQAMRLVPPPLSARTVDSYEVEEDSSGRHRRRAGTRIEAAAIRVIDGDTFDHGGARVRIADIDTPEVDGRCGYETDLAARATGRLRALLAGGDIELHPAPGGRDEDRYGRKLRIVIRGGRSVGDMLVAEGLARTWTGRREPWCV